MKRKRDGGEIAGRVETSRAAGSKETPTSLVAPISPPLRPKRNEQKQEKDDQEDHGRPSLAAIEAGTVTITDHVEHFAQRLREVTRAGSDGNTPQQLSADELVELYRRNEHPHGHHFVVHQHDHPVAGLHYDLRLQFSQSSSISFAIMYGLPGDPNSKRLNRNATETRVHTLWNHLIETASQATGSLLIWDTGEYEVLPYGQVATDESEGEKGEEDVFEPEHENEELIRAFHNRKIRLRLHGSKLPPNYTIALRLSKENHVVPRRVADKPIKPRRRRRGAHTPTPTPTPSPSPSPGTSPSEDEADRTEEQSRIRSTNAYTGAHNTIGSIHQRKWYLSMDRLSSGFTSRRVEGGKKGWFPARENTEPVFHVLGADHERSIVTGRTAHEVMADELGKAYMQEHPWVRRKGWRAVTE